MTIHVLHVRVIEAPCFQQCPYNVSMPFESRHMEGVLLEPIANADPCPILEELLHNGQVA